MVTLKCCQHHDLISHSVTVSWHCAHQFFPYPKRMAKKWQVSIFRHWVDSISWFEPMTVCLLLFYVLATSKVIRVGTDLWQCALMATLGKEVISTMTCYLTKSHYPDTESTSPCPILIMLSTWLGRDKYQFISHCFDSTIGSNPRSPTRETSALQIWPPRPVTKPNTTMINKNRRRTLNSFGHPVWSYPDITVSWSRNT